MEEGGAEGRWSRGLEEGGAGGRWSRGVNFQL